MEIKILNIEGNLTLTDGVNTENIWLSGPGFAVCVVAIDLIKAIQETSPTVTDPSFLIQNNKELIERIRAKNDFGQPIWRCSICDKANPLSLMHCTCGVGRQSDSKIFNKVKQ